eukprot:538891_1
MSKRIYVFEDFDATSSADVFNIRKSLKDLKKKEEMKKKKEMKRIKALKEKQKREQEEEENKNENEIKQDMVETLKEWWKNEIELEQYYDKCVDGGYENMKYIYAIKGDDGKMDKFISAIGIEKEGHIMMVKEKLRELNTKMENIKDMKKQIEEKREKERKALNEEEKQFNELFMNDNKEDSDDDDGPQDQFKAWKLLKFKRMRAKGSDSSSIGDFNDSDLNLSDVLNILDGIVERTGQRCIWTTNKAPPQKYFDPAFLRPGRMDMIIKLGACTLPGIEYLLKTYYEITDNVDEKVEEKESCIDTLNLDGVEERRFTPAQVKQICKEHKICESAIAMMRKLCHPDDDEKEQIIEMKRKEKDMEFLLPPGVKITRSHSGHWFDPNLDPIDETELVDVVSKVSSV